MGNLELEQDPKSVNIKPVKQEKVEMGDGWNKYGFANQQSRLLFIVSEICFILSPGRLYVLVQYI